MLHVSKNALDPETGLLEDAIKAFSFLPKES